MISKIEVRNPNSALLTLIMEESNTGYYIKDVEGITPVKATLVSTSFAGLDGQQYHSSRRDARNIILHLALDPVYALYSVEDLRKQLNDFFMPKMPVALRFVMEDELEVDILGYVESCEPAGGSIFTKDPGVDVSIMCFLPDFFDRTPVVLSGSSTSGSTETSIDYVGNSETGVKFTLNVNRTISEFTIYLRLPNDDLKIMDFEASMVSGDVLTISTVKRSKYATLTHLGSTSSILYGVSPQASWFELFKGTNKLRVYATGAAIPYTIEYTTKYGSL